MPDIERRAGLTVEIEERADKPPVVKGYAAVFNQLSQDLGGYREQISPGAFADALSDDVRLLVNHEGMPFARTASGTLKLAEDQRGLAIEAELDPADPDVLRLLPKMKRGDLSQMSFAFSVKPGGQDWADDDEGRTIRTIKAVRLFDVSVVTYPAYLGTDVAIREMREWRRQHMAPRFPNLIAALSRVPKILA